MAERKLPGSFQWQLLALLLAFLGALALLAQVYGRSAALSARTARLNVSVGLARSAAEAFAGSGSLSEAAALLGGSEDGAGGALAYFDGEGAPCGREDAVYRLEMELKEEEKPLGRLEDCRVRVFWTGGEEEVYALTASRYRPQGEGGGL